LSWDRIWLTPQKKTASPSVPGRRLVGYSRDVKPTVAPVFIIIGTVLSYAVAVAIGVAWLVPVLTTLPAYPFLIGSLRNGRVDEAVLRMIVWAAALGISATTLSYVAPDSMAQLFVHGDAYRKEMFVFVTTGQGTEGNIRLFLPQHLGHAAAFCALALATGSLLAMPLGALLMNYMAFYVGALGAASLHPLPAMALAWVPWAIIRITSFITLGVVLGGPVLGRVFGFDYRLADQRRWLAWAFAGLAIDILLKWMLAPWWRGLILSAAGFGH
jgi:hypothetical protein